MKEHQQNKKSLSFEVQKSKEELRRVITLSLKPAERLQRLTRMIYFAKQFSKNYSNAFQRRLNKGKTFILK